MKAPDFSPSDLDALRGRIQSPDVLEAFDRLVEGGVKNPHLACACAGRGKALEFRYTSIDPRGRPFSFTVSRAHLLFQIRPLGAKTLRLTKTLLARHLELVRRRADEQLQIVVRNRGEADAVVEHLLSRWPAPRGTAGEPADAQGRHGLGPFRSAVEQIEVACRVTGVMDRRHLRAVHIKSWEFCSESEKRDAYNGLLLSPHVAHLFERGYISFADDGGMLVAQQLNSTVLKRWAIPSKIPSRAFAPEQRPFLAWHREHQFEKAETGRRRRG